MGLASGAVAGAGSYFGVQAAANAANNATNATNARFNQAVGYEQPYMQAGSNALNLYGNAVGSNGSAAQASYYKNFQNDPGFQSEVNYGQNQISAQAAAQGQNLSGNTLTGLQGYGQTMLSNEYQTRLNDLMQEAGLGGNAANTVTGASTGASTNATNSTLAAGSALGGSLSGAGNSASNALNQSNIAATKYYYGTA